MAIQDEAALILQLYDLRREETMRTARDWYAREFNPESMADIEKELFGEHSGHLRMVTSYWEMAAAFVNNGAINLQIVQRHKRRAVSGFWKDRAFPQ